MKNFVQSHMTMTFYSCSWFESDQIWAAALVVGEICETPSHWRQIKTLSEWMKEQNIPGIYEIDTRALTKIIREKGTLLGRIVLDLPTFNPIPPLTPPIEDPNKRNLVAEVVQVYGPTNYIYFIPTFRPVEIYLF